MFARRRGCFWLPFNNSEFDTPCSRNADIDVKCPIQEGEYNVTQTVALPKEIPPGTNNFAAGPNYLNFVNISQVCH
jgi:ML domain